MRARRVHASAHHRPAAASAPHGRRLRRHLAPAVPKHEQRSENTRASALTVAVAAATAAAAGCRMLPATLPLIARHALIVRRALIISLFSFLSARRRSFRVSHKLAVGGRCARARVLRCRGGERARVRARDDDNCSKRAPTRKSGKRKLWRAAAAEATTRQRCVPRATVVCSRNEFKAANTISQLLRVARSATQTLKFLFTSLVRALSPPLVVQRARSDIPPTSGARARARVDVIMRKTYASASSPVRRLLVAGIAAAFFRAPPAGCMHTLIKNELAEAMERGSARRRASATSNLPPLFYCLRTPTLRASQTARGSATWRGAAARAFCRSPAAAATAPAPVKRRRCCCVWRRRPLERRPMLFSARFSRAAARFLVLAVDGRRQAEFSLLLITQCVARLTMIRESARAVRRATSTPLVGNERRRSVALLTKRRAASSIRSGVDRNARRNSHSNFASTRPSRL